MTFMHLNQIQLAARWNISHRTLERWRWSGEGPQFIKIGGRVVYRVEDLQTWVDRGAKSSTSDETGSVVLPAKRHTALPSAFADDARR